MRLVDWDRIEALVSRRIEQCRDALEREPEQIANAMDRGRLAALREVLSLPESTEKVDDSDREQSPPHPED